MTVVVAVVVAVVLLASLVTWQASRIDRLHARVEATDAALDAQLVRRASAAATWALAVARARDPHPPAGQHPEADLCEEVLHAAAAAQAAQRPEREHVENDLSRAVERLLARVGPEPADGAEERARRDLADAASRAALARRFHNDAVRDLRQRRRAPLPRLLRLGSRRALPVPFEVDEDAVLRPLTAGGAPGAPSAASGNPGRPPDVA